MLLPGYLFSTINTFWFQPFIVSGTNGQHGVIAARYVEAVKGKRPGLSKSSVSTEAMNVLAVLLRRNHATIVPAVSFSVDVCLRVSWETEINHMVAMTSGWNFVTVMSYPCGLIQSQLTLIRKKAPNLRMWPNVFPCIPIFNFLVMNALCVHFFLHTVPPPRILWCDRYHLTLLAELPFCSQCTKIHQKHTVEKLTLWCRWCYL